MGKPIISWKDKWDELKLRTENSLVMLESGYYGENERNDGKIHVLRKTLEYMRSEES